MQQATLGKSGSEAASQLQGRIARAFPRNSLVNTMNMTAAIQYILTAAGLLVYFSAKTSRHTKNRLSYGPKKILSWMLREARGGLKATVRNKVKPDYHFIRIVFCSFLFFFQPDSCVPWQAMFKSMSGHIEHWGLSQLKHIFKFV